MPPVNTIKRMPAPLRHELDERLRENGYSNMDAHTEWLNEQGVKVSRSALARYSAELKAQDKTVAAMAKDMGEDLANKKVIELLLELGALRVKERRILDQLQEAGYF